MPRASAGRADATPPLIFKRGDKRIIFEDTDIYVDPEFSVYITMNPGYAGRSELPDNLEALLRPATRIIPDLLMICKICKLLPCSKPNNSAIFCTRSFHF